MVSQPPSDSTGTTTGKRAFVPLGSSPGDDQEAPGGAQGQAFPPGDYDAFMEHIRLLANPVVASVVDMLQLAEPTPAHANFIMHLITLGNYQLTAACSWWEIWLRKLYDTRKDLVYARNRWVEFYAEQKGIMMEIENNQNMIEGEGKLINGNGHHNELPSADDNTDNEVAEDNDNVADYQIEIANREEQLPDAKPSIHLDIDVGFDDSSLEFDDSPFEPDEDLPLTYEDTVVQLAYVERRIRWLREQIRRAEEAGTYWSVARLLEFFEQPEAERQGKAFDHLLPSMLRRAYQEITLAMQGIGFAHKEAVGAQQVLDRWQRSNYGNSYMQEKGRRRMPPMMRGGNDDI